MEEKRDVPQGLLGGCRIVGTILSVDENNGWYRGKIGVGHAAYDFSTRDRVEVGQVIKAEASFSVDPKFNQLRIRWWGAQ